MRQGCMLLSVFCLIGIIACSGEEGHDIQIPDPAICTLNYTIPATETVEEHIFQQKHKMLMPENSNYYPYAIGGKTGFTSDALSTLITMADNGGMQLVCVVLRTHGVHIYPDTAGLFEYAFNNFSKVPVADYESSKDVGEILEDGSGNYVMLPQSVKFEDLDMELIPDGEPAARQRFNIHMKAIRLALPDVP